MDVVASIVFDDCCLDQREIIFNDLISIRGIRTNEFSFNGISLMIPLRVKIFLFYDN